MADLKLSGCSRLDERKVKYVGFFITLFLLLDKIQLLVVYLVATDPCFDCCYTGSLKKYKAIYCGSP